MAKSQIPADCTFRFARTGSMVISKQLETLLGICHRMFHAIPERDIYSQEGMGLDIMTRSRRAYVEGQVFRDTEYETMIYQQFTKYTDIIPYNIIAYYKNHTLTVLMDAQYGSYKFQMRTSSDPQLATEIKPKVIRGV